MQARARARASSVEWARCPAGLGVVDCGVGSERDAVGSGHGTRGTGGLGRARVVTSSGWRGRAMRALKIFLLATVNCIW